MAKVQLSEKELALVAKMGLNPTSTVGNPELEAKILKVLKAEGQMVKAGELAQEVFGIKASQADFEDAMKNARNKLRGCTTAILEEIASNKRKGGLTPVRIQKGTYKLISVPDAAHAEVILKVQRAGKE